MQFCCYFYCKFFQIWRHLMSHDNFFWRFCIRSTYKRMGLLCIRLINKNKYYHLTTWKFCDNISISTWEKKKDYFSSMANASNFMQMCQYFLGIDEKSRMCPLLREIWSVVESSRSLAICLRGGMGSLEGVTETTQKGEYHFKKVRIANSQSVNETIPLL